MDSKGEHTDTDNVVRLPREWVGPLDELVPFGSRARAREAERARIRETEHAGDLPGPSEPEPVLAADFWGAGASALHHAVQGPTPPPIGGGEDGDLEVPVPSTPVARARTARPPLRPRTLIAAAGALVTALAVVLLIVVMPGGGRRGAPVASAAGSLVHLQTVRSAVHAGVVDVGTQVRDQLRVARSNTEDRAARHHSEVVAHRSRELTRSYEVELRHRAAAAAAPARVDTQRTSPTAQVPAVQTTETPVAEPAASGTDSTGSSESAGTNSSPSSASASASPGKSSSTTSSDASSAQPAGPTGIGSATGCSPQCS